MVNLIGEFECKLDTKSRLALPAGLRKQLPAEAGGRLVINRGFEPYLVLYPRNEWDTLTAAINRLNPYVEKNRKFIRYFYRGHTELTLDGSGRLLLPRRLLDYAGIQQDIVLLACGNRIECWDSERYASLLDNEPEDFARLAEEIMGKPPAGEEENLSLYREPSPFIPSSRH